MVEQVRERWGYEQRLQTASPHRRHFTRAGWLEQWSQIMGGPLAGGRSPRPGGPCHPARRGKGARSAPGPTLPPPTHTTKDTGPCGGVGREDSVQV